MSNHLLQLPLPLPNALRQWLTLNSEFCVLVCHDAGCQQALSPDATSRHLREKHQASIELRRQAEEYIKQWQWPYNCHSVPLPPAGLAPQPVLSIFNGFQCQECDYLTRSRDNIRKHYSKEHGKKHSKDKEIFTAVQL